MTYAAHIRSRWQSWDLRGIEVSRPVSQLGAPLGLWPETEVEQAAWRLQISQWLPLQPVPMEDTSSVPRGTAGEHGLLG